MKNSIRVSAKTVEEAITEAIIQLEVTSDRLDYEVIEKGSPGFLGIGMKQAVIEAKVKEEEKPEKEKKQGKQSKHIEEKKPEAKREKHKDKKKTEEKIEEKTEEKVEEKKHQKEEDFEITEITKKAVEDFLKGTLTAMGMDVGLAISVDSDNILCVDLSGDNMGILIGKRGQTLDSLQYLANRVANKHQAEYVRIKLDTEGYRARREETLTRLARNLAQKVKKTRRPVHLEPMNPYERRIIHSVLQSNPHVVTHSEGDEPYRKVVIVLKR